MSDETAREDALAAGAHRDFTAMVRAAYESDREGLAVMVAAMTHAELAWAAVTLAIEFGRCLHELGLPASVLECPER